MLRVFTDEMPELQVKNLKLETHKQSYEDSEALSLQKANKKANLDTRESKSRQFLPCSPLSPDVNKHPFIRLTFPTTEFRVDLII